MVEGKSLPLSMQQITQLHSAMLGALTAVIGYLELFAHAIDIELGEDSTEIKIVELTEAELYKDSMVVQASVRILGSWMAEETVSHRKDVLNLFPLFLQLW